MPGVRFGGQRGRLLWSPQIAPSPWKYFIWGVGFICGGSDCDLLNERCIGPPPHKKNLLFCVLKCVIVW